ASFCPPRRHAHIRPSYPSHAAVTALTFPIPSPPRGGPGWGWRSRANVARNHEGPRMFDRLTESFNGLFRKLSGQSNISEKNVADAMADVKTALLEADVHLEVVNTFTDQVLQESLGREVTKSLRPGQEMIGIVHDKLVELLGGSAEDSQKLMEALQ